MSDLQPVDSRRLDALREEIIEQLTLNFAHDHLAAEEFEARISRATGASTQQELMMLVRDLPEIREKRPATAALPEMLNINRGAVKEQGIIAAILGGASRKGVWKPPRQLQVLAVMGGVELDFSNAEIPPEGAQVLVLAVMGGVEITVPPGLNVDCAGIPLLGGFDDRSGGMSDERAPVLKVRGLSVMGGVEVKVARRRLPR